MKADAVTEAAVKAALDEVAESYAKRDMTLLRAAFAPDPDVVMYGTGVDEKRVGLSEIQAQAERDWSQTDTATITYRWALISAAGSVAWAATDAVFKLKARGARDESASANYFRLRKGWRGLAHHASTLFVPYHRSRRG